MVVSADGICSCADSLYGAVNSGEWQDDVGQSYLSYAANMKRRIEQFKSSANALQKIERNLNSINDSADRADVNKFAEGVNRL